MTISTANTPAESNCEPENCTEIAEAAVGRDHFTQHGANKRIGHRYFQSGKYPRHRGRDYDFGNQLHARRLHQSRTINQILIDLAHAGISIEKNQEQHQHSGERDFGFNAESEPQDEKRRQRDFRQRIERIEIRAQKAAVKGETPSQIPSTTPPTAPTKNPMTVA